MKQSGKTITLLPVVAAAAFCGAMLYATGRALDYMFRDVDPERIGMEAASGELTDEDEE